MFPIIGFIGALYVNKENMAVALVKEGLARVSDYLDRVPFSNELLAAQEAAQKQRKNVSCVTFLVAEL